VEERRKERDKLENLGIDYTDWTRFDNRIDLHAV
jgi:hypothetical protein